MALFDKKTKEEKQQEEMQKFIERYQLNEVSEKDLIILKRIANDLAGNGLLKASVVLSMAKAEEQVKVTYLSALVEQNWMMIRQLSQLNANIEKLLNK